MVIKLSIKKGGRVSVLSSFEMELFIVDLELENEIKSMMSFLRLILFFQRLLVVLEESLYIHNIRDMKVCNQQTNKLL